MQQTQSSTNAVSPTVTARYIISHAVTSALAAGLIFVSFNLLPFLDIRFLLALWFGCAIALTWSFVLPVLWIWHGVLSLNQHRRELRPAPQEQPLRIENNVEMPLDPTWFRNIRINRQDRPFPEGRQAAQAEKTGQGVANSAQGRSGAYTRAGGTSTKTEHLSRSKQNAYNVEIEEDDVEEDDLAEGFLEIVRAAQKGAQTAKTVINAFQAGPNVRQIGTKSPAAIKLRNRLILLYQIGLTEKNWKEKKLVQTKAEYNEIMNWFVDQKFVGNRKQGTSGRLVYATLNEALAVFDKNVF